MRWKRQDCMETAGSLTPDLEGAVRTQPHESRGPDRKSEPQQEQSSGGDVS